MEQSEVPMDQVKTIWFCVFGIILTLSFLVWIYVCYKGIFKRRKVVTKSKRTQTPLELVNVNERPGDNYFSRRYPLAVIQSPPDLDSATRAEEWVSNDACSFALPVLQLPQVFHQINERVVPNVQIHPTVNPITVEEVRDYDSSVTEDPDEPPSYQRVILTDFRQEIEPPPSYRESQKNSTN